MTLDTGELGRDSSFCRDSSVSDSRSHCVAVDQNGRLNAMFCANAKAGLLTNLSDYNSCAKHRDIRGGNRDRKNDDGRHRWRVTTKNVVLRKVSHCHIFPKKLSIPQRDTGFCL